MSEDDLINTCVDEIRAMALMGENIPTLLHKVQELFKRKDCKLISVRCFHKAFGADISLISAVAGWSGFGGELDDDKVEFFVSPVVQEFRDRSGKDRSGNPGG